MIASVVGLSILGILVTIIAQANGVDMSQGFWQSISLLPTVGLPIGFVLIIAFLLVTIIRRGRAAKDVHE